MATWQITHQFRTGQFQTDVTGYPIDFENNTIKVALITNAVTPDVSNAAHFYWGSTLNAAEVSGTNYTAGGFTLAVTVGAAGATVTVDSNDPTWAQSPTGFANAYHAVLYKDSGTPATSPVIAFNNISGPKGNVSGPLTLTTTTGLFTQTQA